MSIGTELLKAHGEPATLGSVGFAFRHVASRIKSAAPDIGRSVAPKRVSSPTIPGTGSERDSSGLFGKPEEY